MDASELLEIVDNGEDSKHQFKETVMMGLIGLKTARINV